MGRFRKIYWAGQDGVTAGSRRDLARGPGGILAGCPKGACRGAGGIFLGIFLGIHAGFARDLPRDLGGVSENRRDWVVTSKTPQNSALLAAPGREGPGSKTPHNLALVAAPGREGPGLKTSLGFFWDRCRIFFRGPKNQHLLEEIWRACEKKSYTCLLAAWLHLDRDKCRIFFRAGSNKILHLSPAGQISPGWPQFLKESLRDPYWLDLGPRKKILHLSPGWLAPRKKSYTCLLAPGPAKKNLHLSPGRPVLAQLRQV
jgi:hypothetical protein